MRITYRFANTPCFTLFSRRTSGARNSSSAARPRGSSCSVGTLKYDEEQSKAMFIIDCIVIPVISGCQITIPF